MRAKMRAQLEATALRDVAEARRKAEGLAEFKR
jgi:hypothetical protein